MWDAFEQLYTYLSVTELFTDVSYKKELEHSTILFK